MDSRVWRFVMLFMAREWGRKVNYTETTEGGGEKLFHSNSYYWDMERGGTGSGGWEEGRKNFFFSLDKSPDFKRFREDRGRGSTLFFLFYEVEEQEEEKRARGRGRGSRSGSGRGRGRWSTALPSFYFNFWKKKEGQCFNFYSLFYCLFLFLFSKSFKMWTKVERKGDSFTFQVENRYGILFPENWNVKILWGNKNTP